MDSGIWVLTDHRTGNVNQAVALAEEIGSGHEQKNVQYNIFASLPNSLLSIYPIHITKLTLQSFETDTPPRLIIASGRRLAAVALYLKRKFKDTPKLIQILKPNADPGQFDLIVLPQHDSFYSKSPNVVRIIGALSKIKPRIGELRKHYPEIREFIGVILGGNTHGYKFTDSNAISLISTLSKLTTNHSLPLFISFSRRTPKSVKNLFRESFKSPHTIFDPENKKYNPYSELLREASYIISTIDSVSMCSEAASTGKPLYVFFPGNFKSKKHRFFIQQLMDLNIARRLDKSMEFLENYNYTPLREAKMVADIVRAKVLNSDNTITS